MIGWNAEKWDNLPKKQFFINSYDEAHLLKSCLSFGGDLEGSNEEKMGKQQKKRGSVVKCGETLFEGGL